MPILKQLKTPTGSLVGFHRVVSANVDYVAGIATVNVGSWASQADAAALVPLTWMWAVPMVVSMLSDVETSLLATDPFSGGTAVGDVGALELAKAKKVSEMKAAREEAQSLPVVTEQGTYDCDANGRDNVSKTALAMFIGSVQETRYTDAANERHTLTLAQIVSLGMTMFAQVQASFDRMDVVRAAIDAATTIEEVDAVTWLPAA